MRTSGYNYGKNGQTVTSDHCHQTFCFQRASEHREELHVSQKLINMKQQYDALKRDRSGKYIIKALLKQIDQ